MASTSLRGRSRAAKFLVKSAQSRTQPTPARSPQDLAHVENLFERLGLGWVVRHIRPRSQWAIYIFLNGFFCIGLMALLAVVTGGPFIFPSLGPTAYKLFFSPRARSSAPYNVLVGHLIGLVCGYLAFHATKVPVWSAQASGTVDWRPVISAACSLAATAALMIVLKASHPPAAATTLIVSLGMITKPSQLIILWVAVLAVTVEAFLTNRLVGVHYPLWKAKHPSTS
jgi:CBS domain-containing membrane protein